MTKGSDIRALSASSLVSKMRTGRLSPVEVLGAFIARITEVNGEINALAVSTGHRKTQVADLTTTSGLRRIQGDAPPRCTSCSAPGNVPSSRPILLGPSSYVLDWASAGYVERCV